MSRARLYKSRDGYTKISSPFMIPHEVEKILSEVITQQCDGLNLKYHISAALVKRKVVMATGAAVMRTHPLQFRYATTPHHIWLHAETHCILNYYRSERIRYGSFDDFDLYIMRKTKNGDYGRSWCCDGCLSMCCELHIKNIVYWDKEWRRVNLYE
jgi:hypothetical protein